MRQWLDINSLTENLATTPTGNVPETRSRTGHSESESARGYDAARLLLNTWCYSNPWESKSMTARHGGGGDQSVGLKTSVTNPSVVSLLYIL